MRIQCSYMILFLEWVEFGDLVEEGEEDVFPFLCDTDFFVANFEVAFLTEKDGFGGNGVWQFVFETILSEVANVDVHEESQAGNVRVGKAVDDKVLIAEFSVFGEVKLLVEDHFVEVNLGVVELFFQLFVTKWDLAVAVVVKEGLNFAKLVLGENLRIEGWVVNGDGVAKGFGFAGGEGEVTDALEEEE